MSKAITLPKWMNSVKTLSSKDSGAQPKDVALSFALTLRLHGTAAALRRTAHNLAARVCREQQPKMKKISRLNDDAEVFNEVQIFLDRVYRKLDIDPDQPFEPGMWERPAEPEADPEHIAEVLAEIANEMADPRLIAKEVAHLAEQLPKHQRAGLYMIAGAKNPRAIIMATLRNPELKEPAA